MCTALRTLFFCTCEDALIRATKKRRLPCEDSCHGCPGLHCRAGPVAPPDNYSLAEGHLFRADARVTDTVSLLSPA